MNSHLRKDWITKFIAMPCDTKEKKYNGIKSDAIDVRFKIWKKNYVRKSYSSNQVDVY